MAAEHRRRNEKVKVDVVAFRGDDFRDDVEASDEDIELLYEEESLVYQVPEKRRLRFLLLDEGALADSMTPSDTEIQDYYDFNMSQYSTAGQFESESHPPQNRRPGGRRGRGACPGAVHRLSSQPEAVEEFIGFRNNL